MPKNAVKTRFEGVYSIESTKKRYEGKPDVCFYYVIKVDGKKQWHKAGWRSEGYTATAAHDLRSKHVQSMRPGHVLPTKKSWAQSPIDCARPWVPQPYLQADVRMGYASIALPYGGSFPSQSSECQDALSHQRRGLAPA